MIYPEIIGNFKNKLIKIIFKLQIAIIAQVEDNNIAKLHIRQWVSYL
jgi:hypothetical protein